jgi:hypothetical protein
MKTWLFSVALLLGSFLATNSYGSIVGEWKAPGIICTFSADGTFRIIRAAEGSLRNRTTAFGRYDSTDTQIFFSMKSPWPRGRVVIVSYRVERDTLVVSFGGREIMRVSQKQFHLTLRCSQPLTGAMFT